MNIFIIGSGGREHALVWKLAQSKRVKHIYCAPGNPGIGQIAINVPITATDIPELLRFAKEKKIDLTMVGPEAPLLFGIVDLFEKHGLPIVGPTKEAAQIEGSKIFSKRLMKKYGIPTAAFETFHTTKEALSYVRNQTFPLVIKADGPALGKGVAVCQSEKEAEQFIRELMEDRAFGAAGSRIIVEACLTGPEVSFMVATDGNDFVSFLPAQDHKRICDDDKGPNTGGMGAYAPVSFVDAAMIRSIEKIIVEPTLNAMKKEGAPYQGVLYPGLILTKDGPNVLEYNCRFGDPETQPLMTLLETDLVDVLEAIQKKRVKTLKLQWKKGAAACVVLTSKGYPGVYEKGVPIDGLDAAVKEKSAVVFHAGTKKKNDRIVTDGGRVLGVTAWGNTMTAALDRAYALVGPQGIHFSGMHYRKDIGRKKTAMTYSQVGDNYGTKDPINKLSQTAAASTGVHLKKSGYPEVSATRGESAFVWDQGNCYMASVLECLGTKNLVADAMREVTGKTYYDSIANDTVATFINDLATVGAKPLAVNAYWAIENNEWLQDRQRMTDFITGWKDACDLAGAAWGGGETPTLKGIIAPGTVDLAGSAVGIIKPKKRLLIDEKLKAGDRIILLKSNGVNANGLSLVRAVAKKLPEGYATPLPDGSLYGEAVLRKSNLYARLIQSLFDAGITLHYVVHITGHGHRKIMRARKRFSYVIERIVEPLPVFSFIQQRAGLSDYQMYETFNMGMDYALFLPKKDVENALKIIRKNRFSGIDAGYVKTGERKVIIQPKHIEYSSETLDLRLGL